MPFSRIESQQKPSNTYLLLAYSLIFLSTFILIGYHYPHSNHSQEVPPILALIDNKLFTKDFAIQSYLGEGPRKYYQLLILALSKIGINIEISYFILFSFSLLSVIFAIFKIAELNSSKIWVNYWASGLILLGWFIFGAKGWGEYLFRGIPIPSTFAMAIVIWGIYFTLRGKALIGYIFFGIGGIVQFLVGFMAGLSFFPATLLIISREQKILPKRIFLLNKLAPYLGWFFLLLIIYLPMQIQEQLMPPYESSFPITFIFGNVRVPHHWLPSSASFSTWLNNYAFYAGAAWLAFKFKNIFNCRLVSSLIMTMAIGVLAIFINFLFVEIYPLEIIGKLQFQRILPFSHLSAYILLIGVINQMIIEKPFPLGKIIFFVVVPFISLYGFALITGIIFQSIIERSPILQKKSSRKDVFIYWVLTILFLIFNSYFNNQSWQQILFNEFKITAFIFIAICILVSIPELSIWKISSNYQVLKIIVPLSLILFINLISLSNNNNKLAGNISRKFIQTTRPDIDRDEYKLAKSFQNKSKKDDLILIPPTTKFSFFAFDSNRSVVFSFKNVPYNNRSIQEWGRRLRDITGVDLYKGINKDLNQLFCERSKEELLEIGKKYDANYVLFDSKCQGDYKTENNKPITKSGQYYIEKVNYLAE